MMNVDYYEAGNILHMYNRSIHEHDYFTCSFEYDLFYEKILEAKEKVPSDILCWCLMPNHFHFLIEQKDEIPIYKIFQSANGSYVKIYNEIHESYGSLVSSKLKKKIVHTDKYLLTLLFYIHSNPVKNGLVEKAEDWPFSDYRDYINSDKHPVRDHFYKSGEEYKKAVEEYISNHFDNILIDSNNKKRRNQTSF